ncbi:MAG: serine/threonine protein kinase [Candidatus Sumerlaeaceae bacterium]|nr:serine/threonine protein kinase [Candidatus Sumerlaeaceae bacterium]
MTDTGNYVPGAKIEAQVRRIGRYTIVRSLGRGGMGEVFKAIDPATSRHVAVKILDTEAYTDPEALHRFDREARNAMALDHPNIARILAYERDEHGHPFIVMEYIEGEPLDRFARGGVELPFSQLVDFILQTARGLEYAHRQTIIHRDIKPSNLLVTNDFVVKIIDFGLAKSLWDKSMLTTAGVVVGTPRYIAPEQALGRTVDHRSDIYSLGATFYELVTHQCPFDGDTPMQIMLQHVNRPLTPPYLVNPKVPGDISEIICRMMAKDPNERYQDYETLIKDLEAAKIHRLAKERRTSSGSSLEHTGMAETVLLDELSDVGSVAGAPGQNPYIQEGIVRIDPRELPDAEPPVSRARIYVFALIGLFILVIALTSAFIPRETPEGRKEPSWLMQRIQALINPPNQESESKTIERIIAEDKEKVERTRSRMEGLLLKVVEYKRTHNGEIPTVRQLVGRGEAKEEDVSDAWGNRLIISTENGGKIIAAGRDGTEGTSDDFVLSLSGAAPRVPPPLTQSDAALILEQKRNQR